MKIAEIRYFDNFDNKEHTNIIDLKEIKYIYHNVECTFWAKSIFTILQDGEPVLIENVFEDHSQSHYKIYQAGLTVFDIILDILNSRFKHRNSKIQRKNISVTYFNEDKFFHSGVNWHE